MLLLHALDFVGEMPFDSMPGQFSDQVEDITPLNSRQQVYIFVVPSTDLLYVRLNVGFPCGRTSKNVTCQALL